MPPWPPWSTTCASLLAQVALGGGEAAPAHRARQAAAARPHRSPARPGHAFLEIGQLAAYGMYGDDARRRRDRRHRPRQRRNA
jgi:hypothetical protein